MLDFRLRAYFPLTHRTNSVDLGISARMSTFSVTLSFRIYEAIIKVISVMTCRLLDNFTSVRAYRLATCTPLAHIPRCSSHRLRRVYFINPNVHLTDNY